MYNVLLVSAVSCVGDYQFEQDSANDTSSNTLPVRQVICDEGTSLSTGLSHASMECSTRGTWSSADTECKGMNYVSEI